MPVILLTGFGDLMSAVGDSPAVFDVVACKPFTADSLRKAISQALARHPAATPAAAVREGVPIQIS
jgi:FixJ family two-component response regulator